MGSGVEVCVGVGVGGGGKIRFIAVCPNTPDVMAMIDKTPATISHCHPVAM